MPNIEAITATGTQTIEAPEGKKLVLVIEDAGHRHSSSLRRQRALHHLPR